MPTTPPTVAVVGATGALGREMLDVLAQRRFPAAAVKALASPRSAGSTVPFNGKSLTVEALTAESLRGVGIALFSAGSAVSKQFAPAAVEHGAVVIDNSSAFRMDPAVPLVVPEINASAITPAHRIIANPNCTAIMLLMALTPVRNCFGVERVVVSTYQAASGAGAKAMEELELQTRDALAGKPVRPGIETGGVFHEPYAFNLFSHNTAIDPATGLNGEEAKVIAESRKIWNDPRIEVVPTCIRVPVLRAHAESIHVTLARPATLEQFRAAYIGFPGVRLVDDRAGNLFPTPHKAAGGDDVLVGRIRPDPSQPGAADSAAAHRRFDLFIAGDQLRKGAALNAVQIAERLLV